MSEIIEDLLSKSNGSVYKLSRLATFRALELAEGRPSLLEDVNLEKDKLATIALREIESGKIEMRIKSDEEEDIVKEE